MIGSIPRVPETIFINFEPTLHLTTENYLKHRVHVITRNTRPSIPQKLPPDPRNPRQFQERLLRQPQSTSARAQINSLVPNSPSPRHPPPTYKNSQRRKNHRLNRGPALPRPFSSRTISGASFWFHFVDKTGGGEARKSSRSQRATTPQRERESSRNQCIRNCRAGGIVERMRETPPRS